VDHLAPVEGEQSEHRSVAGSAAPSRRASWAASIVSPIERRPRTRGPQVISMRYAARSGGEAPHFGARPEGRARRSIPYLRYANIGVDGRQSPHNLHSSYPLQFIPFELFTPRTEGPVSHNTDSAFGSPSRHWVRRKGYGEGYVADQSEGHYSDIDWVVTHLYASRHYVGLQTFEGGIRV
jgi:hypothetical protein